MEILVTGGAGFIGSHLVETLLNDGHSVLCLDDLSLGRREHIEHNIANDRFEFVQMDLLDTGGLDRLFCEHKHKFDCVFHLAANSDIQAGVADLNVDLERTFLTTFNVIGAMNAHGVKQLVFSSSSAIYGPRREPAREDDGPLRPVSFYGAAKLSSESYISAACQNHNIRAWIIRFPNVVGPRATHGVVLDFIEKLTANPQKLTILGDGKQNKPYLYVAELVEAILFIWQNSSAGLNCFNVAPADSTTVTEIANIVVEEMGLAGAALEYTGGASGWVGDVPAFQYDSSRLTNLGWQGRSSSADAVRKAVRAILKKGTKNI